MILGVRVGLTVEWAWNAQKVEELSLFGPGSGSLYLCNEHGTWGERMGGSVSRSSHPDVMTNLIDRRLSPKFIVVGFML